MPDLSHRQFRRDFVLFLLALMFCGFAGSVFDSVFNNYLSETAAFKMAGHDALSSIRRTVLELPREIPGLLVVVVSALMFFLSNRALAVFSQLLAVVGTLCIGFVTQSYGVMLVWLLVYSTGMHLFLPLQSDIGMELAKGGNFGTRLGQLQGAGNLAAIAGSVVVFLGFKFLRFNFLTSFLIAAAAFLCATVLLSMMSRNKPVPLHQKFVLKKEYRLYYVLTVLYGMRKQIFMTFGPWVLVSVFQQRTEVMAVLYTVGRVIGLGFIPWLGWLIDRIGEKRILIAEAFFLIFVCAGYGFAGKIFSADTALVVTAVCFITDQLLVSVGMARSTYLKKIALKPSDVTTTLQMGVSLDHVFSITIALVGGLVWFKFGYEYIFVGGMVIALVNFLTVIRMHIPHRRTAPIPVGTRD
jgi:MFS family permease